jgi:hypothetical protein
MLHGTMRKWSSWPVPLTEFEVIDTDDPAFRVLIRCVDGKQAVLVFVQREGIDDYFHLRESTSRQRRLLVRRNLDALIAVIQAKYEAGEVGVHTAAGGHEYPKIDLLLSDLERAPEKLSASVLDIDEKTRTQPI